MKKFNNSLRLLTILAMTTVLLSSCVKKEYDEPDTSNIDPPFAATHTLSQLIAMAPSTVPQLIDSDIVVSAVVIADDSSGNFYKQIIIQDSTAGMSVEVDISNYYSNYPIGRRIFIKCKGLYVANDGEDNHKIGILSNNEVQRIPSTLVSQYIYKGKWGQYISPTPASLASTATIKSNTLILLSDVEFKGGDYGVSYADAPNLTYRIRMVGDCANNEVDLYTSGYAKFASQITPTGKGTMIAVYKLYNGAGELQIRDTRDVNMPSLRCDGSTGQSVLMPIDSLRMVFTGSTTSAPANKKIKGIVISDNVNVNTDPRNMVIQDNTAGIVVRFSSNHAFDLGDEVEVNVSGQELSEYRGLLEVNNVDNGNALKTGTGSITPRIATIADIITNFQVWESTLVTIQGATISGTTTIYSLSNTITDATSSMTLFTRSQATFASQTYPTTPVNITGVLSEFSNPTFTPQISIRSTADVQ